MNHTYRSMERGPRFALNGLAACVMLAFGSNAYALPTGGAVSAGGANISAEMQLVALKQKMGVLPAGAQGNNKALNSGRQAEEESIEVEEIHDENK